ncbi:MAG TPA: ABC transporter permease [Phycisphaerae bacterium]|nr:ABC transporter permease [Phycisphaerae bacterium]
MLRSLRIIAIIAGKDLLILGRSKATLAVIFLPGIVLYTVFTNIFSGPAGTGRPFRVAVVDEDQSDASRQMIESLSATNMKVIRTMDGTEGSPPLTAEAAIDAIRRRGTYRVALVIPKGFHESPNMLHRPDHHAGIVMYYDELEPIEPQIVGGLVQMAAGRQLFTSMFNIGKEKPATSGPAELDERMLVKIDRKTVQVKRMKNAAEHAFLAGIVPMFLLFSAAGAARGILDSIKSGEIRRLTAAPIHSSHLLLGGLTNMLLVQMIQCYVMYIYAWLVFDVAIWQITGGLFAVTLCTAAATIGFGLFLGALCRTPEQIDAVGTIVILAMSAIGGSMVPRHVMPEWMQKFGLFTINGQSYDAFMSVLSFEGLAGLARPCGVLLAVAAVSAIIGSALLGRRMRSGPTA